jgi:hypothetical protein
VPLNTTGEASFKQLSSRDPPATGGVPDHRAARRGWLGPDRPRGGARAVAAAARRRREGVGPPGVGCGAWRLDEPWHVCAEYHARRRSHGVCVRSVNFRILPKVVLYRPWASVNASRGQQNKTLLFYGLTHTLVCARSLAIGCFWSCKLGSQRYLHNHKEPAYNLSCPSGARQPPKGRGCACAAQ